MEHPSSHLRRLIRVAAIGLALVAATAGPARAAAPASDEGVVNWVNELNKSALAKIEAGRFDAAKKHLLDAERMAKQRGGVVTRAVLARTYLQLGAVEIMAGGNPEQAKRYFRRALCRQPRIRPGGPIAAHAEVVSLFDAVRAHEPAACRFVRQIIQRELNTLEQDLPVRINALDCPNEDEALAGKDFIVRCAVGPRLPVATVTLRYRPPQSEEYVAVEMRRNARGWWIAAVPGKDVVGKSFPYYFEGKNSDGKLIIVNGEAPSPNIALIIEHAGCGCD
jgi:hypothetical protein